MQIALELAAQPSSHFTLSKERFPIILPMTLFNLAENGLFISQWNIHQNYLLDYSLFIGFIGLDWTTRVS